MFSFTAGVLNNTTPRSSLFQINTTKGDECSRLTEFYNSTTDRLFWRGIDRWIPGEFDGHNFVDRTNLHGSADIQLRDGSESSGRNRRDRDRQPINERRDEPLLLDHRARVSERAYVQCIGRNCKSLLRREVDPVSFAVRVHVRAVFLSGRETSSYVTSR